MRKRKFLWGIILTLLLVPLNGKAYDFVDNGVQYTIVSFTDLTVSATGLEDISISELVIPETVEYSGRTLKVISIGYGFIRDNDKVQKINIIPPLTMVGGYAFENCTNLEEIKFSECEDFGPAVFRGASSLKRFQIPAGLKSLKVSFFEGCSSIEEIVLPNSIEAIESYAFYGCRELKSIVIPSSVLTIDGFNIFRECYGLKEIIFEDSSNAIFITRAVTNGGSAFSDCPLESVYLGRNIFYDASDKNTYDKPFSRQSLERLTISSMVSTISDGLFYGCSLKGELIIEDGSEALDPGYDFYSASSLGATQYHKDSNFQKFTPNFIYIGRNIEPEHRNTMWYYFEDWKIDGSNLESVTIGGYCTDYPMIISPNKLKKIQLNDNIKKIKNAFCKGAVNLIKVELGSNVEEVGDEAFSGCASLENFPFEQMTSIGKKAFYNCASLRDLKFEKIQSIGPDAFANCPLIETLELPSSIKSLSNAFSDCPLDSIIIWALTPPSCEEFPNSIYLNTLLKIPTGSLKEFQKVSPWKNFWNIEEFDIPPESMEFELSNAKIKIGEEIQLAYNIRPSNTTERLIWSSSNPMIASVSDSGLITGLSEGTTTITATIGNLSASCEITVTSEENGVDEIYMENKESITIFSIDGILLEQNIKVEEFDNFPKGIYIIRKGDKTIKIVK